MNTEIKKIFYLIPLLIIGFITGIAPWFNLTYKFSDFLEQVYFFHWCWVLASLCALFVIVKIVPIRKTMPILTNIVLLSSAIILISALLFFIVRCVIGTLSENMPYG